MATRLERFPLSSNARYRWDEWLDGGVWRLVQGDDYTASTNSLIAAARDKAGRMGGTVRTRREHDEAGNEGVIVQFVRR